MADVGKSDGCLAAGVMLMGTVDDGRPRTAGNIVLQPLPADAKAPSKTQQQHPATGTISCGKSGDAGDAIEAGGELVRLLQDDGVVTQRVPSPDSNSETVAFERTVPRTMTPSATAPLLGSTKKPPAHLPPIG